MRRDIPHPSRRPQGGKQRVLETIWRKAVGRKWRCKQAAGGPRGPLCLFPAVCPCEAVCAAFPRRVASLPHQPPKRPCRGL